MRSLFSLVFACVSLGLAPAAALQSFEAEPVAPEGEAFLTPEALDAARLALRQTIYEMADLADAARQVRWNVAGAGAYSSAALAATSEAARREDFDAAALRMRALDGAVDARPRAVSRGVDLPPMPEGAFLPERAVTLLVERMAAVSRRLRRRHEALLAVEPGTARLMIDLAVRLEADMAEWKRLRDAVILP